MDAERAATAAKRLIGLLEWPAGGGDVLASDVLLDLNVPQWRWQVQGRDAILEILREEYPAGSSIPWWRCEQTTSGVLVELEQRWTDADGERLYSRQAWVVQIGADDRIAELRLWCTGNWDAATLERQRREAPMIRP